METKISLKELALKLLQFDFLEKPKIGTMYISFELDSITYRNINKMIDFLNKNELKFSIIPKSNSKIEIIFIIKGLAQYL